MAWFLWGFKLSPACKTSSSVGEWHSQLRTHGTNGIFTDPWMIDLYGKLVGKYTIPMEGIGQRWGSSGFFGATWITPKKYSVPTWIAYLCSQFQQEEQKATQKIVHLFFSSQKSRKNIPLLHEDLFRRILAEKPHFPPQPPKNGPKIQIRRDKTPNPRVFVMGQRVKFIPYLRTRWKSHQHIRVNPGGSNHEMRTLIWSDPKTNVSGASGKPPITWSLIFHGDNFELQMLICFFWCRCCCLVGN